MKLAVLLAVVEASKYSELAALDLRFRLFRPEALFHPSQRREPLEHPQKKGVFLGIGTYVWLPASSVTKTGQENSDHYLGENWINFFFCTLDPTQ